MSLCVLIISQSESVVHITSHFIRQPESTGKAESME